MFSIQVSQGRPGGIFTLDRGSHLLETDPFFQFDRLSNSDHHKQLRHNRIFRSLTFGSSQTHALPTGHLIFQTSLVQPHDKIGNFCPNDLTIGTKISGVKSEKIDPQS